MFVSKQIKKGAVVTVRPDFGAGEPIRVEVENVDEHKGKMAIDFKLPNGEERWAYFEQIEKVWHDCDTCHGMGDIWLFTGISPQREVITCPVCNGERIS